MILATKIIILAVFVGMVIYDIVAVIKDKRATISRIIAGWGKRFIMIPFTMSVLLGHFFWTQEAGYRMKLWALITSGALVLIISILQVIPATNRINKVIGKTWFIMLAVVPAGVCVGHYFWGLVI